MLWLYHSCKQRPDTATGNPLSSFYCVFCICHTDLDTSKHAFQPQGTSTISLLRPWIAMKIHSAYSPPKKTIFPLFSPKFLVVVLRHSQYKITSGSNFQQMLKVCSYTDSLPSGTNHLICQLCSCSAKLKTTLDAKHD